MIILLVLLAFVIQSSLLPASVAEIISLPDGQVEGTTYTTDNNRTYYAFQGIPYATPPVGDLRFEAPQPPQPWRGVWHATGDSKGCVSGLNFLIGPLENEDCLYISVYTPLLKPSRKLPVMIWIYGGKFVVGSARKSEYGPDFLIEEDVIIVQFNYRLGPLGFLSTGDSSITGNFGLKDQALAIKWTHDNIEHFGGDPDQITILGESAGGASVGLHLVSEKERGLYRAAIVGSGSALTNWTIDSNPKAYTDLLTTQLGGRLYLNDTWQIKRFLQEKSAEEIAAAAFSLGSRSYHKNVEPLSPQGLLPLDQAWPVIEVENRDAFLTESPYELLSSGRFNRVPIIIGICANEAAMFFQDFESANKAAVGYDTHPNTIIPENLHQNHRDNDEIVRNIHSLYLTEGETFSRNLVALTNYQSDHMFTRGVIKHAELTARYAPVFLYQFAYSGRPLFPFIIPGAEKAGHGAELSFLFKQASRNTKDPADILVQNRITRLWSDFAKFLDPTPHRSELIDVKWPVISANNLQYLNINDTLEVRSPIRGASYDGWKQVYDRYGRKPFITF